VLSTEPSASGPVTAFIVIAILKAALTGATEEICYRGMIQPTAIKRFGVPMGILFQSCLYTAFHMHLGAAFFSHTIFLGGVMALGLVFGVITHLSGGVGWAFAVHTALNLVIEWHNLS
jgi:membrane protease YdiL (CAAX protease family)